MNHYWPLQNQMFAVDLGAKTTPRAGTPRTSRAIGASQS